MRRVVALALCAAVVLCPRAFAAPRAVSVRDFGARGDGKASDTRAFRKALAAGAHTVSVPAGTYVLGPEPLVVPASTRLVGDGPASVVRLARGTSVLLRLSAAARVADLAIEGQQGAPGGSPDQGILHLPPGADGCAAERVAFTACRRVCISTDHANDLTVRDCGFHDVAQAVSVAFSRRVRVLDCTVVGAKLHGIQFWGNWKWETKDAEDILITGNMLRDGGSGAIWGAGARRVVVSNNVVDGAVDVGIDLEWCEDSVIRGNTVRNAENGGISLFFACSGVSITGNTVRNDRAITDPKAAWWARAGIWLTYPNRESFPGDRGHRNIAIVGNTIVCGEGDRRGIWIGSESDNVVVEGNVIRGGRSPAGGVLVEQPLLLRARAENVTIGGPEK